MAVNTEPIIVNGMQIFPGKGSVYYTALINQLKAQIREASLRSDFDKVDELQRSIQEISQFIGGKEVKK